MKFSPTLFLSALLCASPIGLAAADEPQPSPAIDAAARRDVIAELAKQLHANYIFPDAADALATTLASKEAHGDYAAAKTADAFAEALSRDMRDLGKDGHFQVFFDPQFKPRDPNAKPSKEEIAEQRQDMLTYAFGIQKVERLEGNVGYLEIRGFGPTAAVGPAYSAAMTILSGTDALILDLRRNGGGEPGSVAYLLSHFFPEGDERHLNDLYYRAQDLTRQYWTDPGVGVHYDKPVYVLTSGRTFSGGEECAYDFQTQKRATLVGETTGGGSNPGDVFAIGHGMAAFIPTGRAINPVTHGNWEHVGVKPDMAVPAAQAQQTAYVAILRGLLAKATDPQERDALQDTLSKAEKGQADPPNYSRPH